MESVTLEAMRKEEKQHPVIMRESMLIYNQNSSGV